MLDRGHADRVQVVTTRSLSYTPIAARPPDLPSAADILGRATGENFPVASVVIPGAARRHLTAFYGFARLADQLGDAYTGDRMEALRWLELETAAALDQPEGRHLLVADAARSVRELSLDAGPLFDLIAANRQDQEIRRYPTFDALLDYCRLSANPVGRLVLGAFGAADDHRIALSDALCTGLQLVEHWQDVAEDAAAGRVYLPEEDMDRFGVDPGELTGAGPVSTSLRALMAFQASRARSWLDRGLPLASTLAPRPRLAVLGFWAGGQAALDGMARRRFDVLRPAPKPPLRALLRRAAAGAAAGFGGAGEGRRWVHGRA